MSYYLPGDKDALSGVMGFLDFTKAVDHVPHNPRRVLQLLQHQSIDEMVELFQRIRSDTFISIVYEASFNYFDVCEMALIIGRSGSVKAADVFLSDRFIDDTIFLEFILEGALEEGHNDLFLKLFPEDTGDKFRYYLLNKFVRNKPTLLAPLLGLFPFMGEFIDINHLETVSPDLDALEVLFEHCDECVLESYLTDLMQVYDYDDEGEFHEIISMGLMYIKSNMSGQVLQSLFGSL